MEAVIESFITLCRILALPIFPKVRQSGFNNSGHRVTLLLFMHVLSGIFVIIGIYAAGQATSEEANIKGWVVVMVFVTIGLISLVILLIAGCTNRLTTHARRKGKMSDPSLKLRIGFLWVFGLAVMAHVALNFATYIECIQSYSSVNGIHVTFSMMSNTILSLFLIIQIGFISYYQNASFTRSHVVNFASIFILAANFIIWYNGALSNIYVFGMVRNNTIPRYSNESYCFRTSKIQNNLTRKITPYLFPFRMEFCILASSFIITFWRWPMDYVRDERDNTGYRVFHRDEGGNADYQVLHEDAEDGNIPSSEKRNHIHGPHIFAIVCGIVINMPTFFSKLLLSFVPDEKNSLFFYAGESLSAVCSIAIVYICSYSLNKNFRNSWRHSKLTTNEYILILTSSGMVSYFVIGVLTAFSYPKRMEMYVCCRYLGLLEIFLQTYFLIKVRRYHLNGNHCIIISSCGIILMLTNLIHWLLNSYSQNASVESQEMIFVGRDNWLYIESIFVPLLTFYRFFSGMSAYSLYYKFKPDR